MTIIPGKPSMPDGAYPNVAVIADLAPEFARMVDKALAAIVSGEVNPDAVFGEFNELIARARSVSYHEGKLLEAGIVRIAACNPDLVVMPQDRPMPIVPAAAEFLKRNEWSTLEGIRLRSEVHYRESYTPDLVIVNRKKHSALIIDVKRSLASYQERRLNALRQKMMSVALIAADWLYVECKAPPVSEVGIAIIDGADEAHAPARGIFGLSELDHLLEVTGAGAALTHLRAMFAARVREELEREGRKALERIAPVIQRQSIGGGHGSPSATPEAADDNGSVIIDLASSGEAMPAHLPARVRVGFARSREGP